MNIRKWLSRIGRNEDGIRDLRRIQPKYRHLYRERMIYGDCADGIICLIEAWNNGHRVRSDYEHQLSKRKDESGIPVSYYLSQINVHQPRLMASPPLD
jgi:hypothetical protein